MPKEGEVEDLREVLGTVTDMVPNLIKGIIESVFSAEAGKSMGAAVASFYKELKASGLPDDVAIKMTENYSKTFTDFGEVIKQAVSQSGDFEKHIEIKKHHEEHHEEPPEEEE